ncbi:MAG: hypothetical protein PHO06_03105 [Clostridia bacterium]|nr:hypothetical protein [Clostridia bacterium]
MITKELDKIIKDRKIDLTASAKQFAETCGTEINIAKDYEGREIFELLQNCEDASTDQNFFRDVSVKITLKDNELKIQNTGEPFSLDGITSLMYQTLSPKSKVKLKTIGYKGLGFRSVLNWSSDIKIFTKEYSVAFSKSITDEWYSTLSDEIKKEMEDRKIPVPILKIGKNISAEKNELDENYDTCIRLLCDQDKIDKILTELKTFKFYELLFLQHINKIEIKIEDDYWREIECVLEEGNKSIISYRDSLGTDSLSEWQMYYPNEKIEVELEEKDKSGKVQKVIKNFDVAFGYPLDDTIQHELRKSGVLFSYFATSNEFRLPFICHATFELESNRKNINDNSNNKRLVPYLIDEICKFAELIAMQMKDFSALNMLITDQNFGRLDHKGFGFYLGIKDENAFQKLSNGLKDKILTLNIFPTVSSICKKASEVKYSRYKWADYINVNDFSDLMLQPPIDTNQSIINYLNQKLSFYTDDEMIKNLNKSLDLYDEKKLIELTYLFVMQFPFSKSAPRTIIDESGNRIKEENANIYLNKESDVSLSFPKWSKSYFIKQSFEDALKNKFEASTKRSLADKLTKFNVDEYSYLPVLRSLISQAGNDKEKAIDLIKVLYASWESRGKLDVDIWSLPSRPKIQVVNRNGQVIDASSCYLGNEYDNALGERLLKCINITDFIAEPKVFELDNKDLTALRKFFNEIFVASFPKIELIDLPYIQRKKYLEFNKTKYSLLKVDKTWEEPYDYEDLRINTVKVYTIANIEDILSESKSEDILLWTVKDRLLNDKLGKYNESEKSFIKGRPYKKVDDRFVSYNQMLSYLNFIFSTSKWIEAEDGIKKMPKELVIDSTLPKAFSQFIATPIFDENLLIQNGISKFSALDILLKLGAVDDIKKLDKELIYKILLELPEKDITNEFGGSIYDWLNKKFDTNDLDSLVANNTNYSKFLKEGKLLCYSNRGYVPVAEVSYIDKKVVCESILQKMNTMKLHRRAGGPKIEKMFGAKSFKGVEISNISVTKCDDKTQQEFNKAYEILKPYVYADRYYKDKSGVNLRALQNIDIILCSNIIIMYNNKPFEVGNYENIYSIGEKEEKSIAYIKIPDGKNYYKLSQETDFQMSLAEIISAILDINGKENYQILIGKTEADMRKIFLASNTEENLKLAKEKLCDKDYFKRKFWHSVGSTYGIKLTEDTELDSILNQLDINISEWPIDYLDVL